MDIKRVLVADEVDEEIILKLRKAGLTVDVSSDIAAHRLLEVIKVKLD